MDLLYLLLLVYGVASVAESYTSRNQLVEDDAFRPVPLSQKQESLWQINDLWPPSKSPFNAKLSVQKVLFHTTNLKKMKQKSHLNLKDKYELSRLRGLFLGHEQTSKNVIGNISQIKIAAKCTHLRRKRSILPLFAGSHQYESQWYDVTRLDNSESREKFENMYIILNDQSENDMEEETKRDLATSTGHGLNERVKSNRYVSSHSDERLRDSRTENSDEPSWSGSLDSDGNKSKERPLYSSESLETEDETDQNFDLTTEAASTTISTSLENVTVTAPSPVTVSGRQISIEPLTQKTLQPIEPTVKVTTPELSSTGSSVVAQSRPLVSKGPTNAITDIMLTKAALTNLGTTTEDTRMYQRQTTPARPVTRSAQVTTRKPNIQTATPRIFRPAPPNNPVTLGPIQNFVTGVQNVPATLFGIATISIVVVAMVATSSYVGSLISSRPLPRSRSLNTLSESVELQV